MLCFVNNLPLGFSVGFSPLDWLFLNYFLLSFLLLLCRFKPFGKVIKLLVPKDMRFPVFISAQHILHHLDSFVSRIPGFFERQQDIQYYFPFNFLLSRLSLGILGILR